MKRIFLVGLFIQIFPLYTNAFGIMQATGSRIRSIGNCSVALNDFWSCFNNPAGFASYENISIGVSYQNKFMIKELGYKDIGILYPLKAGVIAVSASQFGCELYSENIIGLGLSKSFGNNLRIGLKLDYLFFKFSEEYDNKSAPTFELGLQYQINESLCLGAYIFNPINVKLKTINKDKVPIIMRLGFSYYINEEFLLTSEIEENSEYNFSYRFGIEYEIHNNIFIRSGFQLKPEIFTFGIGYNHNWGIIDVCAQMNQALGSSISCSFVFKIKNWRIAI